MTTTCAENIALLRLLDELPSHPQVNIPSGIHMDETGRALSFQRELWLSTTVAFLASVSGDAAHVIATSIEELPAGGGLRILVAINKGCHLEAKPTLASITTGLETVFSILSRAAVEEDVSLEAELLDAIITMSRKRILGRLGYRKPSSARGNGGKAPLSKVLRDVIAAVQAHYHGSSTDAVEFIRNAMALQNRASDQKMSTTNRVGPLRELLIGISELLRAVDIPKLLAVIKSSDLAPSCRDGFPHRLKKLARYPNISRELLHYAKKLAMLRNVTVTAVSLSPQVFASRDFVPKTCCLGSCVDRCQRGLTVQVGYKAICGKLENEIGVAKQSYLDGVKANLTGKIHAEVQIVAHLELHPPALKPRIVASNKDACYLCNLFIQVHGQYHIPKTHGKLYSSWRIPNVPALAGAQTKLNQALERRIREAIRVTISSGAPRGRNHPNESTVFSFASTMTAPNQSLDSVSGIVTRNNQTRTRTAVPTTEMPRDSGYMSNSDLIQQTAEAESSKSPTASLRSQQVDQPHNEEPESRQMGETELVRDKTPGENGVAETPKDDSPGEAAVPEFLDAPTAPGPQEMAHSALGSVCSVSSRSVHGIEGHLNQRELALPHPTIPAALIPGAPVPLRVPNTTAPKGGELDHSPTPISELLIKRQDGWLDHPAAPILEAPISEGPTTGSANTNPSRLFQSIPPDSAVCSINQISTLPEYHYPSAISPTIIPSETLLFGSQSLFRNSTSRYTAPPPRRSKAKTKTIHLVRGQFYSHRLDIASPRPFCYTTGHLTVYPEFVDDKMTQRKSIGPVEMLIRWLDPGDQASLGVSGLFPAPKVIGVDSIPDYTNLDSGSPDQVFVAHGPDVVEMRVVRSLRR